MSPPSPYKPKRQPKARTINPNLFELSEVSRFWDHKKRSRLNQQEKHSQLQLMATAGALLGGEQAFLTINLDGRPADRVIERIMDRLARTGWDRRYVVIDVPDGGRVHDHIHLILFNVTRGTEVRTKLAEIAAEENIQHPNRADVRQVRTLPGLVRYLYGRNMKRDGGRLSCDKRTRDEAEALSGLTPAELWRAMRETLPANDRQMFPESPPVLAERSEYERQYGMPRKRARKAAGESGAVAATPLAGERPTASPESPQRGSAAPPGAFDLLDTTADGVAAYFNSSVWDGEVELRLAGREQTHRKIGLEPDNDLHEDAACLLRGARKARQ